MSAAEGFAIFCDSNHCDEWVFEAGVTPDESRAIAYQNGWTCDSPSGREPNAADWCPAHARPVEGDAEEGQR